MANKDIIQELNELESSLAAGFPRPVYAVPEGYFDGFADQVIKRIRAFNAVSASEELSFLSPLLADASKELPYSVSQVYFDGLPESVMENIRHHADYQTANEELESLSPLLSSIGKKVPFSVPQGYFENFRVSAATPAQKQQAKVIPIGHITSRKWMRYAAAAVIVSVIALSGVLFFRSGKTVDASNTRAWVEQNMKKVSTNDINSFIQQTSEANGLNYTVAVNSIKEMMKDVSDNDIQNFLNETEISDESIDDLFLN